LKLEISWNFQVHHSQEAWKTKKDQEQKVNVKGKSQIAKPEQDASTSVTNIP
jgi:hypothetical protein